MVRIFNPLHTTDDVLRAHTNITWISIRVLIRILRYFGSLFVFLFFFKYSTGILSCYLFLGLIFSIMEEKDV